MSGALGLARLRAALAPVRSTIDAASLHALAALLLLVQAPHLTHLPPWVSASGAAIVALRLHALHRPGYRAHAFLLSPLALTSLAAAAGFAIRLDYGYFIGRDPGVAFLSVLVAAKFAEVRRASDATLLLCLASFLLLTQYFYSQTIIAALLTLPAVLALGNALAVLRDPASGANHAERLRLVGTLLAQGLPLAALLFVLFPRLPGPLWSLPEDSMATTGLSDTMEPGTIGELSRSDAVAFRVEFDGAADGTGVPPSHLRYWRGPVLDTFDGRRWTASPQRREARLPNLGPAARERALDYTVMLEPHRRHWLFALDMPVSLPRASTRPNARILARLTHDGQLLADEPVDRLIRYRQSSLPSATFATAYRPTAPTLELAGRNPRSAALARRLRAESADERAFAAAVMDRFREAPYTYTLRPQLLGDAPVDEFLFDTKRGFCEHYAAAFVVLMRAAGIPARVVTGYLGGEMNGDYMIVRQSDAHAWAEAWINGSWQRYDPTGAVAPSRVESGLSAALPGSVDVPSLARGGDGWLTRARLRWDAIDHAWQRFVVDFDDESQGKLLERLGFDGFAPWQLAVAVLGGAALWCLVVLGLPGRGARRTLAPVERLRERFESTLARLGVPRAPGESPAEHVARAAEHLPRERGRIERLGEALIALRFAPPDPDGDPARLVRVRNELRRLRLAALTSAHRRAVRVRAGKDGGRGRGGRMQPSDR